MSEIEKMRLLSETDRHPKISKNGLIGVLSGILHLSPSDSSGHQVCPMASAGCIKSCLNYSGYHHSRKYAARIKRTQWFFADRAGFMSQLVTELHAFNRKAKKLGLRPNIRLNGTSDIPWENVRLIGHENVMEMYPNIAFHDYTKRPNRKNLPENYKLVFSRSEDNNDHCIEAIQNGMNVAVVFADKLPKEFTFKYHARKETANYIIEDEGHWTLPVIDGDVHDFRYGDYEDHDHRVVVGLLAKGAEAKRDRSGFVVRV